MKQGDKIKRKILDEALILFGRKGIEATSMKEIAEKSEVKKSNLFYHFTTKENLILDLYKDCCREMIKASYKTKELNPLLNNLQEIDALKSELQRKKVATKNAIKNKVKDIETSLGSFDYFFESIWKNRLQWAIKNQEKFELIYQLQFQYYYTPHEIFIKLLYYGKLTKSISENIENWDIHELFILWNNGACIFAIRKGVKTRSIWGEEMFQYFRKSLTTRSLKNYDEEEIKRQIEMGER